MAKFYHRRHWWFPSRTALFWTTFVGCHQYDHHPTWRYA